MRTTIEVEEEYVKVIMNRYGVQTEAEAVALALRHLAGLPMTRAEALALRGAGLIADVPADGAQAPAREAR